MSAPLGGGITWGGSWLAGKQVEVSFGAQGECLGGGYIMLGGLLNFMKVSL